MTSGAIESLNFDDTIPDIRGVCTNSTCNKNNIWNSVMKTEGANKSPHLEQVTTQLLGAV